MPADAINLYAKDDRSAIAAREHAQWIAYGPSVFQAARVLRDSGILAEVEKAGAGGLTLEEIVGRVKLPVYGVRVLTEAGLGIGLLLLGEGGRYTTTKTTWFLLHDAMTRSNMDFSHDVSYAGMFDLDASIRSGRPEGLKRFGQWRTIYQGLSELPAQVRKSWLAFDHYYSDQCFPAALPLVFKHAPRRLLDVGGNTGKWARLCVQHDPQVQVTILDLEGQVELAKAHLQGVAGGERISYFDVDLLDERARLPDGYDAVWMSQFLDCFSEPQIVSILRRCARAMMPGASLFILEPFWDRQRFKAAAFCMQQASLYFTALANGDSQLYRSTTFLACVEAAGFKVVEQVDEVGGMQTLLRCQRLQA